MLPASLDFQRERMTPPTASAAAMTRTCACRKSAVPITIRVMKGSRPASKPAKNSRNFGMTYVIRMATSPMDRAMRTAG